MPVLVLHPECPGEFLDLAFALGALEAVALPGGIDAFGHGGDSLYQVASMTLDGRASRLKLEKTKRGDPEQTRLETTFERELSSRQAAHRSDPVAALRSADGPP